MTDEFAQTSHESTCRREGATCTSSRSEVIEVDGETLIAYFCSKNEYDIEWENDNELDYSDEDESKEEYSEFDIREKLCQRKVHNRKEKKQNPSHGGNRFQIRRSQRQQRSYIIV